jgi:membrane dipeptidase
LTADLIFDGHNDLLARLFIADDPDKVSPFIQGRPNGHLDLPRARIGGFAGGFFAVFIPTVGRRKSTSDAMRGTHYDVPLPPIMDQQHALEAARKQIGYLKALEEAGSLVICTSIEAIEQCLAEHRVAALLHMEGAEAIDPEFEVLEEFHRFGLRSLGPVWSRPTIFAHGVPFRFPSTPDTGAGLTDLGKRLISKCNQLGVLIDLSHLNEAGFWDVAKLTDAPLVATHSNAHALCPHSRNLTDRQLDAIAESDGMVGLNYAAALLRADGQMRSDIPLTTMLEHLDHMIKRLGEDRVGLGSDFDGAIVPAEIADVAGLPVLVDAMRAHGYGETLIAKICRGNWLRVLRKTWKN